MKKIGILFGSENTFPYALIERINELGEAFEIKAEILSIGKVQLTESSTYDLIIDRISDLIPYYRSYLLDAASNDVAILNNPLQSVSYDKFNALKTCTRLKINTAKTILLPSKERPSHTNETSFRNLKFPMEWEEMLSYVGFPSVMKPNARMYGDKSVEVNGIDDLWQKHENTGCNIMMLQEKIEFDHFIKAICVGGKNVHLMPFEPNNPHHLRYAKAFDYTDSAMKKHEKAMKTQARKITKTLGLDINVIDFVIKDGKLIVVDACTPIPDADAYSIGSENFKWMVDEIAELAISRAKKLKPNQINCTFGQVYKAGNH
ncbi:ATP-grasp domain-containing protein [Jiulongibacter sp. NS-SX5]|uniref:ATP-grasp domain-containing protein n=1 Tax=Jiulongibacter sp. NS-SX5 TaxID=3463854 RepID=UPI004057D590